MEWLMYIGGAALFICFVVTPWVVGVIELFFTDRSR